MSDEQETAVPPLRPMGVTGFRAVDTEAGRAAVEQEFFKDAVFPQHLALLTSFNLVSPCVSLPMLVALVGSEQIDPRCHDFLRARAAEADAVAWSDSVRGQVGWSTMAPLSGDPVADAQLSYAKLNLDLTAPVRFKASFVFHLAETLAVVDWVVRGGLFALALPELVQELAELTFADAMDSLPFVVIPAAPQLAQVLDHLASTA